MKSPMKSVPPPGRPMQAPKASLYVTLRRLRTASVKQVRPALRGAGRAQICRYALPQTSTIGHAVQVDEQEAIGWHEAKFAEAAREAEALAPRLVGLAESDAHSATEAHGVAFRIAERDGVSLPLRADRRPNRINVTVENRTIVAARVY